MLSELRRSFPLRSYWSFQESSWVKLLYVGVPMTEAPDMSEFQLTLSDRRRSLAKMAP